MFGITGLDPFGLFHAVVGLIALVLGLAVIALDKGTDLHKRVGYGYVGAMFLLNATALAIYDLYGRVGPFHVAAVISLATVAAAFVPVMIRRPRKNWLRLHAEIMCWSYVGLVSAFIAEIAVRIPGSRLAPAAIASTAVGVAAGAALIYRLLPDAIRRTRRKMQEAAAPPALR
jgi:uncharacterized membrane protein